MKLSNATVCVNMVTCHVCHGKGSYKDSKHAKPTACPRCKGDKDFEEECSELVDTGDLRCPACLGTSLLPLHKLIKEGKNQTTESVTK